MGLNMVRIKLVVLGLALCATSPFGLLGQRLRSPWDGKTVVPTNTLYACGSLPAIAPDLTTDGFYKLDDPTHSIIDPVRQAAYTASSGPVKRVGLAIVAAADAYRKTGSRDAAACATQEILTLARAGALAGKMSSNQAYYVQGWVAGAIAIAYLKVRDAHLVTSEQSNAIAGWLLKIGDQTRAYYDAGSKKSHGDATNNHLYWAGVELAAIGVVADNRADFYWAVTAYDTGVHQIEPDGTLPREMARGQRALHYHLYALAPLVLIAEFGEANGEDLYSHANGAIHRLVAKSVAGLADPEPFRKAGGAVQEMPKHVSGDQIGWAPPYARRFAPQPALDRLIQNAPSLSVYYLGGLPPPQ